MRAKPLFSVITIARNARETIADTIASVRGQSFEDFEYTVIDGASTDGTLDVVRAMGPSGCRIISEPDEGIADAMNKGILRSTGEVVIHMNAGDVFADSDVLRKVAESFRRERWHWAVGSCDQIDRSTGTIRRLEVLGFDYDVLSRIDYLPHQSTFLHRKVFQRFGLFDCSFRIAMDYEYWLRIGRETAPYILPIIVSRFDLGGSSSDSVRNFREEARARLLHGLRRNRREYLLDSFQFCVRQGFRVLRKVLPPVGLDSLRRRSVYQLARELAYRGGSGDLPFLVRILGPE